jgi:hypothetical protein
MDPWFRTAVLRYHKVLGMMHITKHTNLYPEVSKLQLQVHLNSFLQFSSNLFPYEHMEATVLMSKLFWNL